MRAVVVDIGNTAATLGLYEDGTISRMRSVVGGIRKAAADCETALLDVAAGMVEGVIIASVVPEVNPKWKRLVRRVLGCVPHFVSYQSPLNFTLDYPHVERIGADRLADAVGAVARYGAPVIIVDFGTALNFEVVDARPAYTGGVLAPGLPLMTSYLHEKTALLPLVDLNQSAPAPLIGKSTEEAIAIGARIGYRGIVREIVTHLQGNFAQPVRVIATGGYAKWVLEGSDIPCTYDADLTLFGLGQLFERLPRR